MAQLISGVLQQLGDHRLSHRPFHHLGAKPVLVIREPLIRERLIEQV